jgi:hypothetical protein
MENRQLFLQKLILKLKSGDARSIHLDALPGRYARLDVFDLINLEASLHLEFLNKLLSGKPFSFQINVPTEKLKAKGTESFQIIQSIIRRLNSLYYREMDEFAEYGTLSFGFGYPLLIKRDPSNPARILKAPLFIWHLQIERNIHRSNSWTIRRTEDHPVLFNQVLQAHIESGTALRWENLSAYDDETPLDETTLQQVCKEVLSKFNVQAKEDDLFVKILPCTNKQAIENLSQDAPWIRWSGVFGLYKTQKQPIIKDLMDLAANTPLLTSSTREATTEEALLTPVLLDPSQETVLQDLHEHKKVIIQGPPGTGKSQSISAIISSSLLRGQRILVVCEKRTALDVIKKNLEEAGLGDLIALIDDVYADRNAIVQRIRTQIEEARQDTPYFRINDYEYAKQKVLNNRSLLNERIGALHKRIFGDDTWLELAEKHRQITTMIGPETLNIPAETDLSFNFGDFQQIRLLLDSHNHLMNQAAPLIQVADQLPLHFWLRLRADQWPAEIKSLAENVTTLHEVLRIHYKAFGAAYYDLSKMSRYTTALVGLFSASRKSLNHARDQSLQLYTDIYQGLVSMEWPLQALPHPLQQENMMKWPELILHLKSQILPIAEKAAELSIIQEWHRQLETIPIALRPIWKELAQKPEAQRLLLLSEWYYRHFLEQYAHQHQMNKDAEFILNELVDYDRQIKPLLSAKVLDLWRTNAKALLRQQDLSHKRMLYNLRKNKQFSSRNTLRTILSEDFEYFTTAFPVLMLNPVVASSILPLKSQLFDIIILDEASQLRVEDTFAALFRGRYHVISGDEHQMPPSSYFSNEIVLWDETEDEAEERDLFLAESASLLEYAVDAGYHPTYLDFHYRSRHPDLIAFSNAGFYGSRLIPMPPKTPYQALFFKQVAARYSSSVNKEEAKAIVDFLYDYAARHIEKMPSIGVGTLNLRQRDLIQDMLWEVAFSATEKNRLLETMMSAGLFIKNLENIQGDERDIVIISTTFAPDERGNFRQNFGPINRQNGYQLLNVLITRAKTELHLFSSIPETIYMNFEEELRQGGNTGKALLYAYISYVKAVSEGDHHRKAYILKILQENNSHTPVDNRRKTTSLPKYVSESIELNLPHTLEQHFQLGGFDLEAAIRTEEKFIYLQTERLAPHRNVHYRELMYRPAILKTFNIDTQRIWAYQWWKQPNTKAKQLLGKGVK